MTPLEKFLKEYKKLNKGHYNEKDAKAIFDKLQKEDKKKPRDIDADDVTFIQIPGLPKDNEKKKGKAKKVPEVKVKTPEELALEEQTIAEQEKVKRMIVEGEQLQEIINGWELGLRRSVTGEPACQYPLHPVTRRLASPYDIIRIIERGMLFNDELEKMESDKLSSITFPSLLITLIADPAAVQEIYKSFQTNPFVASKTLYSFYITKGLQLNEQGEFRDIILAPLRTEYVTFMREQFQKLYPKTIELNELTTEKIKEKSPLDNIHNSVDLIAAVKKNPKILGLVSDDELVFYKLTPGQIIQLRIAAAISDDTRKRNKAISAVLVPIPVIPEEKMVLEPKEERRLSLPPPPKKTHGLSMVAAMMI